MAAIQTSRAYLDCRLRVQRGERPLTGRGRDTRSAAGKRAGVARMSACSTKAARGRRALAALVCSLALAHEGGMHSMKPTAAAADLKRAREALDAAKRKLAARGRYGCCVKP